MSRPAPLGKAIVVVYGAPKTPIQAKMIQDETRHVLLRGGNVLIATDKLIVLSDYLPNNAGDAYPLPADVRDPIRCLPGFPECPFVSPGPALNLGGVVTPEQNPFAGLNKVATNRPGVIFVSRVRPVPRLAYFHEGTAIHPRKDEGRIHQFNLAFAVGQDLGYPSPSRWMAMADEDVLSNEMLAAKGTDNFLFAFQLVSWLRGPEGRSVCAFYEYGERKNKFDDVKFVTLPDMPGPPFPPIPPLKKIEEQLTDFGNRVADEVQTNDKIHSTLVGNERGYARWLRGLAVVAAGVAAFYLLRRAFAGRQPSPGPIAMPLGDGPPGKLLAVLRQEMVRGNNFTPAVTAYIEETFRLAGLPDGPHAQMPPIAITGMKGKKVELMNDIATLWRVLFAPADRPPIHYAVWKGLEPAAENVRRLAVKGRWRFAPTGGAA